ncbi:MAG TPA: CoA pyrophosphatase [Polyangiales bacterium]|nr:CoA pyrophosphatase [Polyangiales bacterium]
MPAPERLDERLRKRIADHLASFERVVFARPELVPSAVAVVLVAGPALEPAFLLTRRAAKLHAHGGQFALPGGRLDAGEDVCTAARRELHEELGVELDEHSVLGLLDDFATRSGYVITPVVLWGPEVGALTPNPAEVAVSYRVPLRELYRPDAPILTPAPEGDAPILSLPLVGTEIYSPTAAIIYQLRELALEGRLTRVHHYEQPRFAWR